MIKINLSKVNGLAGAAAVPAGAGFTMADGTSQIPKVLALFAFTLILFSYEKYDLSKRKSNLSAVQQQHDILQKEVSQFGSVRTVVDDLVKERNKLNQQLGVIQKISQKRAAKLNTIVQIQKELPQDVWFTNLVIDSYTINIKGYARTPTSVQELVRNLNEYEFLSDSINRELKRVSVGNEELQEFDILAKVKQ